MARLSGSRPNATDDALVAHAVDLLECPPDEEMLTSARLHYALASTERSDILLKGQFRPQLIQHSHTKLSK